MKRLPGLLLLTAFFACCAACKKMVDLPPDKPKTTLMNVVNATADTLNTFQNGTRFNYTSSFYPGGSLGYLSVIAGEYPYQIKKAGSPDVLLALPLKVDTAQAYSLFITGYAIDRVFLTNDVFLANNDTEIRFVNTSPNRSFDIKIGSNFNYANRAFKSVTPFVAMTAGKSTYQLYEAGGSVPIATGELNLTANRVYTLFTKGTATGTGDAAFGVKLILNR
ncbi:DUF4397 domain-containing protein [Mucilaginibacter auburnensis]|nr:DUF4397 domain-containing protein [Mucilaginibacter auburnensis]